MSDHADEATTTGDTILALRLANRVTYQGESETSCVECDTDIPEGRRKAIPGVQLCAFCQHKLEIQ